MLLDRTGGDVLAVCMVNTGDWLAPSGGVSDTLSLGDVGLVWNLVTLWSTPEREREREKEKKFMDHSELQFSEYFSCTSQKKKKIQSASNNVNHLWCLFYKFQEHVQLNDWKFNLSYENKKNV